MKYMGSCPLNRKTDNILTDTHEISTEVAGISLLGDPERSDLRLEW